jgi:Cof subfamily protein (haloacid dehalogenase superfamily)
MKAVFFDIDGTLWDDKMNIPDSTIAAIRKLRENGHLTFICSGRSRASICAKELLDIGFDGIISGCGTEVEYHGEVVFEYLIPEEDIHKMINVGIENNMSILMEGPKYCYYRPVEFEGDPYLEYLERLLDWSLKDTDTCEQHEVNKFSVALRTSNMDEVVAAISDKYDPIIHHDRLLEIVPHGFSKATGIKFICDKLGIAIEDTYAFGDSNNDLDMLSFVAHGIAMGNGTDLAIETAGYKTTPLHEDGIYNGLKHYNLI